MELDFNTDSIPYDDTALSDGRGFDHLSDEEFEELRA